MTIRALDVDEPVVVVPFRGTDAEAPLQIGHVVGRKPGRPNSGEELLYLVDFDDGTVGQYYRAELIPFLP